MIRIKRMKRYLALLVACGLLVTNAGCVGWYLAATSASFGLGWFMGALGVPMTTETQCFRNGEPIDCSELSQFSE